MYNLNYLCNSMRLFRIDTGRKFIEYRKEDFSDEYYEKDLESLLENNPDSIINEEILLIGRQVTTNFNTRLDLIGLDRFGNTVIMELKRDRTPRDTFTRAYEEGFGTVLMDWQEKALSIFWESESPLTTRDVWIEINKVLDEG